jgi:hypothetical protein
MKAGKIIAIGLLAIVLGTVQLAKATLVNSNYIIQDDIEYYIQTDKSIYNLGENVEMLFRVTNLTDEEVHISCNRSGVFNLLVEKNNESVWAAAHWFTWDTPTVILSAGESKGVSHIWDMIDDNGNLVDPGIYDVVGVMYNGYTEVAVPITVIPEPASLLLLGAGFFGLILKRRQK